MSSIKIILIILTTNIYHTITINRCHLLSAIDLQLAAYSHPLILHVQPIYSSEEIEKNLLIRKVLVREVIKIPLLNYHQIKTNDKILVEIDNHFDEILEDSCWHLLRIINIDLILFLNQTNTNEFILQYPPVESTIRVRQNIDAVMNYEAYSPQVIIKTRVDKPVLSNDYSLQCNARGNPLPRLLWSKTNQTFEYYPSAKQCKIPCRIYSIQTKYQSVLYFQPLTNVDSGIYVCYAENAINQTMASVNIHVDQINRGNQLDINMTCANLKFCHDRGQCVIVDNQLKCLCDNRYFGEQCETNYDDIIKKQYNAVLLFKSRFLAGCILILIAFILVVIAFISCVLSRNHRIKRENISVSKPMINETMEKSEFILEKKIPKPEIQQSSSLPTVQIINQRPILTKESSTATDDDSDYKRNSNSYINANRLSLNMDKTETKTNHLILSEGYLEFYQPDVRSGLIHPLTIRTDTPRHYTKSNSYHNRFLLTRPVD